VSFRKGPRDYWPGVIEETSGAGGPIRLLWETPLTGGVMSHVRLDASSLFISAMDGSLAKLDASTGRVEWRSAMGGYCHSSPKVLADRVVVGSSDGKVRCFRRSDGKPLWSFGTGGPVYASAEVTSGVLCAASGDGFVYGLSPEDGSRIWRYEIPRGNTSFVQSPIATDGTRFFLGAWDSHLYVLNAKTGELEWRAGCCADKSFAYSAAIGGPAVGDGRVFVPADGNVLYCFDTSNGNTIWQVSSPGDKFGYSGPCLIDGRLYVGCLGDSGEVRCVDAKDGSILWVAKTGSVIYDSSPSVSGGLVAVGSVIGLLSIIRAADGGIAAQYQMPIGHFLSSPASEGRRVYAATYSDRAMAFEIKPD
jgi:outer membrane protein assembly factor BamB